MSAHRRGIPAPSLTEDGRHPNGEVVDEYPLYHSRHDRIEALSVPYALSVTRVAGAVVYLASEEPRRYTSMPSRVRPLRDDGCAGLALVGK